ncbi:MAG: tetratricopeptide repeat protein [Deltaproteobacteria bacterium]|jgi:tetratricopeptide (TPR) repeat protein|nr:MAG: tetratricopeptide repeat protein [Deltaproteobacteria bacterium]
MLRAWLTALAVLAGIGFSSAADSKSPLEHDKRWVEARNDLRQGKTAEAKTEFEELLKQYPNEPDLHLFVGMSLLRLRDPRAALSAIKKAIDIDPNHIEARTLLGYVELEVRGDADAAIKEYSKVIELRPDLPEAYSNLAVAQKKKGELNEAIVSLNKALERKPDFASAITTRGAIFAEQNKWADARRDFEAALKIDPQDQGALQGLARVLENDRDYAGAQRVLAQLNSRSPNFVYWLDWGRLGLIRFWWILLSIAIALALGGRFKKARTEANG